MKIFDKLFDFIFNSAINRLENGLSAKIEEDQLKNIISSTKNTYSEDKLKYLTYEQEFDFDGLNKFMENNICQRIPAYFYVIDPKEKMEIWKRLMNDACEFAHANTKEKRIVVNIYVEAVLKILQDHYVEKIDNRYLLLAGMTADAVVSNIESILNEMRKDYRLAIEYRDSFAEMIDNIKPPWESNTVSDAFHFTSNAIQFQSRENEIESIHKFLESCGTIKWMAVVAEGGTGKSRLLRHYMEFMNNDPLWKVVWFEKHHVDDALKLGEYYHSSNLLIIIDNLGKSATDVGKLIRKINSNAKTALKIRLLLSERMTCEHADNDERNKQI